jgi:hypothetical protein
LFWLSLDFLVAFASASAFSGAPPLWVYKGGTRASRLIPISTIPVPRVILNEVKDLLLLLFSLSRGNAQDDVGEG